MSTLKTFYEMLNRTDKTRTAYTLRNLHYLLTGTHFCLFLLIIVYERERERKRERERESVLCDWLY